MGGVALFEAHAFFLQDALNKLVIGTGLPSPETLELHGNEILAGRNRWRAIRSRDKRRELIASALKAADVLRGDWRLFGVVINKAAIAPRDPVEYAFEQLCSRFDKFLLRRKYDGKKQSGLVVLDKSTRETRLQALATSFRDEGHSWGKTRRIVDVPFFVDSKATRTIQFADLVTYAMWRSFEKRDHEFFDIIKHRFDREGGVVHGLLHERYADSQCPCPYCESRRAR